MIRALFALLILCSSAALADGPPGFPQPATYAPGATPYGGGPVWIHNPFVR